MQFFPNLYVNTDNFAIR